MNTSEQILVIVLATTLALFLILSIVIATQVIRLLKTINKITQKAEHIVESAESVSQVFKSAAGSFSVAKIVGNIIHNVTKDSKKRED